MLLWILIGTGIIALDQIAKVLVTTYLNGTKTVQIIPYLFDFVYVKNTGAAFSILSGATELLGVISVLFCLGVIIYWCRKKPQHPLLKTALVLLFAGAFGNAIDRIFRGFVVDFISTAFMDFPVFNVADISIVFGAALLIIYTMFFDKEDSNGKDSSGGSQSGEIEA